MDVICRELQWKNLFYSHKNKRVFYCCLWPWPHSVFAGIRVFLGLYAMLVTTGLLEEFFVHSIEYYGLNEGCQGTVERSTIEQRTVEHRTIGRSAKEQSTIEQSTAEQSTKEQRNTTEHWYYARRSSSMVFFTHWTNIILTLHMVLAAFLTIVFYKRASTEVATFRPSPTGVTKTLSDNHLELLGTNNADNPGAVHEMVIPSTDRTYVTSWDGNVGRELTESTMNEGESRSGAGQRVCSSESHNMQHKSLKTLLSFKILWCLSDIISVWAPIVTIVLFVHLIQQCDHVFFLFTLNTDTLNSVIVVVDHLVSPRPVRLLHFVAPLVFGVIYVIFSVVYWYADHVNHVVYSPILDWNNPVTATGFCLGISFVAIPLLQLFLFVFYQLKCLVYRKLYGCSFYGDID